MNKYHYKTPIGVICIEENENKITALYLDENIDISFEKESKLIKNTYNQIMEYIKGKRKSFDIPIKLEGTEFQKKYGKYC